MSRITSFGSCHGQHGHISARLWLAIGMPLSKELPLFLTCFILYSLQTFRSLLAILRHPDPSLALDKLSMCFFIYLLIGYLLCALVTASRCRWVKIAVYAVVIGLYMISCFLSRNFGMTIAPNIFQLLAETTRQESTEILNTFLFSEESMHCYFNTAILIACVLFMEWLYFQFTKYTCSRIIDHMVSLASLVILTCGIYSCRMYVKLFQSKSTDRISTLIFGFGSFPSDPFSRIISSSYAIHMASEEMRKSVLTTVEASEKAIGISTDDSLNVVLIIGESYIKKHAQLYGYPLQTTPCLQEELSGGHLFVFDNVVSPFNLTSQAMRNMLCTNSLATDEKWYDKPYFPSLFKSAGYNVLFWDNQKNMDPTAMFSFALNSFIYNDEIQRLSYSQTNKRSYKYDEEIVSSFVQEANLSAARNLVIFHLMGQHVNYADRYPDTTNWNHFNLDSFQRTEPWMTDEKKKFIVKCDNATLYNDYVVKRIMDIFRGTNTVMVYLSDHGEEVYDYRDHHGRSHSGESSVFYHFQYDVPFVIWCSDSFREIHPDVVTMIEGARHRPLSTDNLPHLLLYLGGISTTFYDPKHNLIAPEYEYGKRIVGNNVDYDVICNRR